MKKYNLDISLLAHLHILSVNYIQSDKIVNFIDLKWFNPLKGYYVLKNIAAGNISTIRRCVLVTIYSVK